MVLNSFLIFFSQKSCWDSLGYLTQKMFKTAITVVFKHWRILLKICTLSNLVVLNSFLNVILTQKNCFDPLVKKSLWFLEVFRSGWKVSDLMVLILFLQHNTNMLPVLAQSRLLARLTHITILDQSPIEFHIWISSYLFNFYGE